MYSIEPTQENPLNRPCTYWKNQIEAVWDEDPSFEDMEALLGHLAACKECRATWEARAWAQDSSAELWQVSAAADAAEQG